jgi:cell division protein FtsZ
VVREAADPNCNVIFGTVVDDTLGDDVRVTVIATGFDDGHRESARSRPIERDRPAFGRDRASEPPRRDRPSFDSGDALDVPSFLKDK